MHFQSPLGQIERQTLAMTPWHQPGLNLDTHDRVVLAGMPPSPRAMGV